ncbi:hypothetical protein CCM_05711 [Cordyceps militaris CM01]|uniref:Uncharacterized protein n=1 Tax=Cordyceps militaris (strain CM01) TaxID=983644 RepID=G3JGZ7_CORMM|nr:uncharacterized protein CCM_05711 [Cordyceps militaris CM01]EGX91553.1 hypothetical protein CCM_05711 [Cordyceps militaris CM01]
MSRRSSRLASAAIQQPAAPAIVKSPPKSSKRPKPPTTSSPPSSIRGSGATKASSATDMPTLPFADSHAFRAYMIQAGRTAPGVWLRIAKKSTAIPTVTYDEAIDEALCCGWIDGQRRRDALDARYFLQRFTPRRRRSAWSQRNVDKVAALAAAGRMLPAGRAEVDAARADGRWDRAYAGSATVQVPADFRAALEARPNAAAAFDALSRAARYPFLHRLQTVKKEETRTRKMAEFVELLDRGETL